MTSKEIRQQFLDFFRSKGHAIVDSSPVVPHDDPTLMFTNAGMNQFKDVFLGTGSQPYVRAADTQKCIRAGGKHNDLDDVGQDTYHHTFFEMLGNWSFGDYFKKEAIEWAWELLTKVYRIDKSRLHATYFEGDKSEGLEPDREAAELWRTVTDIDPSHIHPGNKKDNFWEMGDTGPCGPCSEIHIDLTPDKSGKKLVNAGDARVMEIWNLVFIQFNRGADGKLTPLPAKHVDTGMGFERLCSVLQGARAGRLGKFSNYDTDVFTPIFRAIQKRTAAPDYRGTLPGGGTLPSGEPAPRTFIHQQEMIDVSYRVIADHIRTLTFAITDGAIPDNSDRGQVLRSILRRAFYYGRQYMNMHEPFLCDLVQPLVDCMSGAFPELAKSAFYGERNPRRVAEIIREEEESFLRTLDRGIGLFDFEVWRALLAARPRPELVSRYEVIDRVRNNTWSAEVVAPDSKTCVERKPVQVRVEDDNAKTFDAFFEMRPRIPGRTAFKLHDTYGFPISLTVLMAHERGLKLDLDEYERLMEEARQRARASARITGFGRMSATLTLIPAATSDEWKHSHLEFESTYRGYFEEGDADLKREPLASGKMAMVVLRGTCFYSEQGGQVGDTGTITSDTGWFEVRDTQCRNNVVLHVGAVREGYLRTDQTVRLQVDAGRRIPTMKHHTSTHILNWALRQVLELEAHGDKVNQKGSLVDPEKTRFDFSHNKPLSDGEIERVESLCREQIEGNHTVYTKEVEQKKAREINTLRAVFGEKYPDVVRVVSIGADIDQMLADPKNAKWMKYSVEFCGGTHLKSSREAGALVLTAEEGVAKGVRRVVGIAGELARKATALGHQLLREAETLSEPPTSVGADSAGPSTPESPRGLKSAAREDLPARIADFQQRLAIAEIPVLVRRKINERLTDLQKQAKEQEKASAASSGEAVMDAVAELLKKAETVGGITVVVGEVPAANADALRAGIDWVRNKTQASAVLLATVAEGKVSMVAGMSKTAVERGLKAGDLIKEISPLVGGKGGGRPDMAQGGGPDASGLANALAHTNSWVKSRL